MDGDGDLDIVVTPASGDGYWIENELGREAESLFAHEVFSQVTPTAMGVGDVDGDHVDDIVVGHVSGAKVFFNKGEWAVKNLGIVLHSPRAISVEDLDGDGDNDILIRDSRELTLIQNDHASLGAQNLSWPGLGDHSFLSVVSIAGPAPSKGVLTLDAQRGMLGIVRFDGQDWQPFMPLESAQDAAELFEHVRPGDLDGVVLTDENDNEVRVGVGEGGELVLNPVEQPGDTETSASDPGEAHDAAPENTLEGGQEDYQDLWSSASLSEAPLGKGMGSPDLCLRFSPVSELDYSASDSGVRVDLSAGEAQEAPKYWWLSPEGESWKVGAAVTDVRGSDHADTLTGDDRANDLHGLGGSDELHGRGGDDFLQGNAGNDFLYGEDGDDTLHGGQDSDMLYGGAGRDALFGDKGDDYLFGGDGDDTLEGGNGTDYLFGDSGDDGLYGGNGSDVLYGGDGQDTYHYDSLSEAGDTVYSFTHGEDHFEFEFGSHVLYDVSQPYSGSLGLEGDGFVWEDTGGWFGHLYYDPDLSTAGDETLIAEVSLEGDDALTVDDLSVV
ncbi:calcium-binding protein [Salidesulfovibrio onnuriiensis]|uniref:calcium-binding protein n=1 Tax=Salidesulfovibrio onnuriiensis TaxID=2583823 RepID=UPI0011C9B25E|nr:calcium-binding protein [Salidesulfovibrio onnuriiensis]